MTPWLIPALKAVLPHIGSIISVAVPAFTRKKTDAAENQSTLQQQQITELQSAASQNATHIKQLAEHLQVTVAALQQAAAIAEARQRRAILFCIIATVLSAVALVITLLPVSVL